MRSDRADITPDTKVAELLSDYPELEETLLGFSPAFVALKNPVLRRTVARVTSLRQAAKVGEIDVAELVNELRQKAGLAACSICTDEAEFASSPESMGEEVTATHVLDVRPVIAAGEHPKEMVLEAAGRLQAGEVLEFIAPFTPEPLVKLLRDKGFTVIVKPPQGGAVSTFVRRFIQT